jgi:cyclopropane-fatty-acyl-phospholipid synthase
VGVLRSPPPPPEEAQLSGGLHTRARDRAAISHHYDVSNDFYRLVLGPSMVYSCAVWESPDVSLEEAQAAKLELICRKLDLQPGMRLLDVGCGWGGMILHAARHHGVEAVGVTLSGEQAELARARVAEAGLSDRVEIRLQDYRDVADGPYDAISSIGMFEHVGRNRMEEYFRDLHQLLPPGGRLLNHAISRPGYPQGEDRLGRAKAISRRVATAVGSSYTSRIESDLMRRYVFPDGELHEVGVVVSMMQENGFEVRHLESIREHYALTLRHWVSNLEANWDAAVAEAGEGRARIWRLYMAASALNFDLGGVTVQQVLAVKPDDGDSHMPLRPSF